MSKFQIIMPAFNAQTTIAKAIMSIKKQTLSDWELIVIDDGSTDRTASIVSTLGEHDRRIQLIETSNGGPSKARNIGLEAAYAPYIAFLDADDRWHKDKLWDHAFKFDQDPKLDIAYARVQFFSDQNSNNNTISQIYKGDVTLEQALALNPSCTMSNLVVRRSAIEKFGFFSPDLHFAEDQEWIARAVAKGAKMSAIDKVLVYYRTSEGGLSADLSAMKNGWHQLIELVEAQTGKISKSTRERAEATYDRYLTRRSLRLGKSTATTFTFLISGLKASVPGFFQDFPRAILTIGAALVSACLPPSWTQKLFSEK
jgi:glycosyltransferase involved in cell wall biosynthesis